MSCATCHQAGRDWSDGRAKGFGTVELDRRTPSLWNVGYQHWFGWDGAADSLWMQSHPADARSAGDGRAARAASAGCCATTRTLACGYERAFGERPGDDDEQLLVDAAKALAAFQADAGHAAHARSTLSATRWSPATAPPRRAIRCPRSAG